MFGVNFSNEVPGFPSFVRQSKEQLNQLYQFNEFFQGLYTDLFSNPDEACKEQIQKFVLELLTMNPHVDLSGRRNAEERRTSERSLELLAQLVPFPQTMKFRAKKQHINSMFNKDKFEETKCYFLENPPLTHLKPIIHKVNWKSPSGAALLTILASRRRFPDGLLAILSKITGISENTLKWKRRELLDEKSKRPIHSIVERTRKPKIPPDMQKEMVAEIIERLPTLPRLQSLQKFCVTFLQRPENLRKFLKYQNPDLTEDQIQTKLDFYLSGSPMSQQALNKLFHASYNWIVQLLDEEGIGLYAPLTPVNGIDQTYANIFISKVSDALKKVGRSLVLNLDETSVKISMSPKQAVNFKEAVKRVKTNVKSSKACFTAVGIIGADGTRYDPLIIAKGTTQDCGKVIDKLIKEEGLRIHRKLFSKKGWMTGVTMLDVLDYVAEIRDKIKPGSEIYVVLDVFRAHLCEEVKLKAKDLKINFITVPANGTGIYQPLDVLIFGILKQSLRKSYRDWLELLDPSSDIRVAVEDGIRRFVQAWEGITKEHILSAWDRIPHLMENYKSKKRNLDDIYADIDQINEALDDFIDMNVIKLSNIVKKESDIYRDVGLFHYESINNFDESVRIESGSANLSSSTNYQMDNQFNCVMTDEDLIDVQNQFDDIYTEVEEIYQEYEEIHREEEDQSKEQSQNRSLRNLHYDFADMDNSSDEDDLYQPKKRAPRQKNIQSNPETIFSSNFESKIYVSLSPNHPQCIEDQSLFNYNGYFNVGNTCYMNSCFIVLYHFFEFRDLLDSIVLPESIDLTKSFIEQFRIMLQSLSEPDEDRKQIQNKFCQFLNLRKNFTKRFGDGDDSQTSIANSQNDAYEFLEYILGEFKNDLEILGYQDYAQNLTDLLFFRTSKVCESFLRPVECNPIIPLGISLGSDDILDCIEAFFDDPFPIVEEGCRENCFERLLGAQSLFIFVLKRFSSSRSRTSKIRSSIKIHDAITITEKAFHGLDPISVELQLYAIVVHKGRTLNSGHYYTYLKPDPNGQWYLFNDSQVQPIKGTNFLQSNDVLHDAYVVFYKNALQCT